jgi:hypothetical protein
VRFKSAARHFLSGAGFSQRPFTRSERLPRPRPPFRGQSSRPAASMPAELSSSPVCLCSPACCGFDPQQAVSTREPRRLRTAQHTRFLLGSPLPVGALTSLRIKASARFGPGLPAFRKRPISLRSPPTCPALSCANRIPERPFVRSPPPPFDGRGSMLPSPPAGNSCPEPASRNGLLLARNDCPAQDHHSDVKAPGLLLRCPAEPSSGPLTFCSTTCHGFDPAADGFSAQTRCLNSAQHSRFLFESPLPVGAVLPLRI